MFTHFVALRSDRLGVIPNGHNLEEYGRRVILCQQLLVWAENQYDPYRAPGSGSLAPSRPEKTA